MSNNNDDSMVWPVIHSYSRAQALADGVLIDVSATAREAGFVYPTAVTIAVWEKYVRAPQWVVSGTEELRLCAILSVLHNEIRHLRNEGLSLRFAAPVASEGRPTPRVESYKWYGILVRLKAVCGPGDNLEPVLTIMMPNED